MAKTVCEDFQDELVSCALSSQDAISPQFRSHLDVCRICSSELAETQDALNMLPIGLASIDPSPQLRSRLQQRIRPLEPWPATGIFDFEALKWEQCEIPGVRVHWLRKEENGTSACLLRIPAGNVFPNHRHVGVEDCLVLQGGFRDSRGEYDRGDYLHYDAGSIQRDLIALDGEDCVLFLVNQQGIEFLD